MPSQLPLHDAVFAAIAPSVSHGSALVLTANQRAARALHLAYAQRMQAEGKAVWAQPDIHTWESWAASLWQQLILNGTESRVLLSSMQERRLWRKILAEDAAASTLRSPESLASLAADAWSLLARFGGLDSNGSINRHRAQFETASTDTRTFFRWAQYFERICRKDQFLSSAQLDAALTPHIAHLAIDTKEIALIGFDQMTPAQAKLCDALREAGITVNTLAPKTEQHSIRVIETADEASEMRAAAHAIRQKLANDPNARIAVIVPDIASVRTRLENIFLSELAPELWITGAQGKRPFEFSLGITLDRLAMTSTAINLLRWTIEPLPLEEISALILSPYLAGAQNERYPRATWDAERLRKAKLLQPEIPLEWVLQQPHLPPMLQTQFSSMQRLSIEVTRQKKTAPTSYSGWMEHAAALLSSVGWPGGSANAGDERALDSAEFQLRDRWQEMLDEATTLDFSGERIDFTTALAAIERSAAETLFAPQSHNAPVQIMGALKSAGSAFDAIWFLGATDMAWPSISRSHPFIPWTVQRILHMPGSDTTRALQDCIAITQRIAASAPEITFSFAHHGSEGDQRSSTCLRSLSNAVHLQANAEETASAASIQLEDAPDDAPLPPLPETVVRGGAAILKLQAMCPFRAFAERRLNGGELDSVEAGLDAGERGDLIHRVMAGFWNTVKTRHALEAMSPDDRLRTLNTAIQSALATQRAETPWQRRYLEVQREWLLQLLPAWLDKELDRPPFQVIRTEQSLGERSIGPLRVQLRVDRIDAILSEERELPGEEKDSAPDQIILDYKTGTIGSKPWDGPRPDEPQLPLYAVLAADRQVNGIAFAKLKVGKMELQQCTGADFHARSAEWNDVLTALATGFAEGDTAVDPKKNKICDNCAIMPLCRIRETQYATDDGGSSDD